jgi:Protein of unknown function (DUF2637)
MSDQLPAGSAPAAAPHPLRVLALSAAGLGVCALAAAAFVLSYAGLHAIALQAGVSTRLARGYPLIVDVLLVIVLAAVLSLRGAGWPTKLLAWTCLLVLLAAAAAAGALHAIGHRLPHRPAAITAAVLPWALLLIAVVLLLAMLRQLRLRRAAAAPRWQPHVPPPVSSRPLIPGFTPAATSGPDSASAAPSPADASLAPGPADASLAAGPADASLAPGPADASLAPGPAETMRLVVPRQVASPASDEPRESELAIDAEPVPDDPSSDEATPGPGVWSRAVLEPAEAGPAEAGPGGTAEGPHEAAYDSAAAETGAAAQESGAAESGGAESGGAESSGAEEDSGAAEEESDPEMPVFHRMWSAPTPPAGGDES